MALANVAVELARRDRRVLVVDFDLEAPGLDTFELLRPQATAPGIVDFVSEYLATGQAPDVEGFVFEAPHVGASSGALWIMPAGTQRGSYAGTLASIDWSDLYERHDGFLLFEDLKEQWKHYIQPDYVLIDSRTGHTDVGGICTRQLPDAVSILFFPNEQNLRGLNKVVQDIRAEPRTDREKEIKLHFIMSNVPDLDDENQILEKSMKSFRRELGFDEALIIHRYDSLALLNQVVFTKDRPKSRLASEYRDVAEAIIRHNLADRESALEFLEEISPMRRPGRSFWNRATHPPRLLRRTLSISPQGPSWASRMKEIDDQLKRIEKSHRDDGEVLFRLGTHRERDRSPTEAKEFFDKAIDKGYRDPEVYLRRAEIRKEEFRDDGGSRADVSRVIRSRDSSPDQVLRAIRIVGAENLKDVEDLDRLYSESAEDRIWVAERLNLSKAEAEIAVALLRPVVDESSSRSDQAAIRYLLGLSCVALGRFTDAIASLQGTESDPREFNIANAFNYAMAVWGETSRIVPELFERVIAKAEMESKEPSGPNNLQCMAVAHWAVGNRDEAQRLAESAVQEIQSRGVRAVSCWRYLQVSASEFEEDVGELLRLIRGDEAVRPRFFPSGD